MVQRMIKRGLPLAVLLVVVFAVVTDVRGALSAGIGVVLALANLLLAARIIGVVAENNPRLLLPGALVALTLGLAVLTGIAVVLTRTDVVDFTITGLTLIGAHLVLVLWEAPGAYARLDREGRVISSDAVDARS